MSVSSTICSQTTENLNKLSAVKSQHNTVNVNKETQSNNQMIAAASHHLKRAMHHVHGVIQQHDQIKKGLPKINNKNSLASEDENILKLLAYIENILKKFEKAIAENAIELEAHQLVGAVTQLKNFVLQAVKSADEQKKAGIISAVGGFLSGMGNALGGLSSPNSGFMGKGWSLGFMGGSTLGQGAGAGMNIWSSDVQKDATNEKTDSEVMQGAAQELLRQYGETSQKSNSALAQFMDELNKLAQSLAQILEANVVRV